MDECSPTTGGHGTVITFNGNGFGADRDDVCVLLMPEGVVAARASLATGDTLIQAVVGAVPAGAAAGSWMIMKGEGGRVNIPPDSNFSAITDVWGWEGDATISPGASCGETFAPAAGPNACIVIKFQVNIAENKLKACLPFSLCTEPLAANYPLGTGIEVDAHFDCLGKHYDCFVPPFTVNNIGALSSTIAAKIAAALNAGFNNPDVTVAAEGGIGGGCIRIGHVNPDCIIAGGGTIKFTVVPEGCLFAPDLIPAVH